MPRGLCKVRNGWGDQHGVRIRYFDGREIEIPMVQYEALVNSPHAEELPWDSENDDQ